MYFGSFDTSKRDLTRRDDGFDDASELNKKMKATEDDLMQTKDVGGTAINVQSKYTLRAPPGSFMEFVSHTQEELRNIFGRRRHRLIRLRIQDSESSEEDVCNEKLEETEGWKLLMEAIESKCENKAITKTNSCQSNSLNNT